MRTIALSLATAALVLAAGEASAHARLIRSDPKAGTTVPAPAALHLSFSESIVAAKSSVSVSGPGGAVVTGKLSVDPRAPRTVTVPLIGGLKPGAYKVKWTMTTEDTHTMDAAFGFKVK